MKTFSYIILFCFAFLFSELQAQTQVVKDSLSISKVVGLQEKAIFNAYEVKFKSVVTDSRCPKNVMCVRAGEAEVLLSIYKNGTFLEDKKIRIDASGFVLETNNLAFNTDEFKIYGFALSPYPDGVDDIDNKSYQLEIVFKPKGLE